MGVLLPLRGADAIGPLTMIWHVIYEDRDGRVQSRAARSLHRTDIAVAAPFVNRDGTHVWRVPLDSEKLGIRPGSVALLTVSTTRQLEAISFSLASRSHATRGTIRLEGCAGSPDR